MSLVPLIKAANQRPYGGAEKLPVCTGISLMLGFLIELLIFYTKHELRNVASMVGGAMYVFMLLLVIAASVVNLVLWFVAHRRGEAWSLVPVVVIGVWLATIALAFFVRDPLRTGF
jgi:hypothetical protein